MITNTNETYFYCEEQRLDEEIEEVHDSKIRWLLSQLSVEFFRKLKRFLWFMIAPEMISTGKKDIYLEDVCELLGASKRNLLFREMR